jgi:TetR/AcrR family transcriptional repressor of nem operon
MVTGRGDKTNARDKAKRETREALLRAALEMIPERGLDVSLDDLCERAGYTRGAFYVHFADRDALLAAVMERVGHVVLDALIGATGHAEELPAVVARFVRGLSTGAYPLTRAGGVRPYQLLDACARSPAVREQYVTLVRDAVARLGESLARGQTEGAVRGDVRADDLGLLLVTLAIGVHTLVDLDVNLDLERATASLLSLWLGPGAKGKESAGAKKSRDKNK